MANPNGWNEVERDELIALDEFEIKERDYVAEYVAERKAIEAKRRNSVKSRLQQALRDNARRERAIGDVAVIMASESSFDAERAAECNEQLLKRQVSYIVG